MNSHQKLSLEQQFKLRLFQDNVQQLTQEEAQQYLVQMLQEMMLKDNIIEHLLKALVN